ncbi:MAG: endonuclease/exonuclease/phosphatase family protein [Elusimicrobia bacterium]|nr:endonuclease/exonuclease/phosphatase family protein [Elusimicrobiota bacterium]
MKTVAIALSVLTLNIAGPRRVHQGWQTRRAALAARLQAESADAAAFQDIWRAEDLAALSQAAGFQSTVQDLPLGLAVASRLPIVASSRRDLGWDGGALRARIVLAGRAADVYSVRLDPGADAPAAARRLAQLFDLAEFIRAESTGSFVLLGDFAASPEEPELPLFLDMLGARDLCMPHGDDVCGRTFEDRRVDYAIIPYSSSPPRENARAAFTEAAADGDEGPLSAHFGLAARLDSAWTRLASAAEPDGRLEALATAVDALDAARADTDARARDAGLVAWRGARRSLQARAESMRLAAAAERARTALSRAVKPFPSRYE